MATLAAAFALKERRENSLSGKHPDREIRVAHRFGKRVGVALRRLVVQQAEFGVDHRRVGAPRCCRTRLTVSRDGAINDVGSKRAHRRVTQAQAIGDASPKVLDEDVAGRGEAQHQIGGTLRTQVDRQEAFAGVLLAEDRGDATHPRIRASQEVTFGGFDLQNLGAQVGERAGAGRTRDDAGEVQDATPRKGAAPLDRSHAQGSVVKRPICMQRCRDWSGVNPVASHRRS